jgi:hypothetical protein
LQEVNFNLVDSFNCFGTLTERVEIIYQLYEKEIQDLFYELTNDRFKIDYNNPIGEVDFGNGKGLLSSGYQAILRILLELLYYQDMEIQKNALQHAWIIIDELDEYLSPKYSAAILEFLKKKFPWGRWVVTTHSCDLVAFTNNCNLIILDNGNYEVVDINDYTSISEVQVIFDRIFGNHEMPESHIENILRRLLNNKINGAWGEKDEECLKQNMLPGFIPASVGAHCRTSTASNVWETACFTTSLISGPAPCRLPRPLRRALRSVSDRSHPEDWLRRRRIGRSSPASTVRRPIHRTRTERSVCR